VPKNRYAKVLLFTLRMWTGAVAYVDSLMLGSFSFEFSGLVEGDAVAKCG
jgi:hypothetical protein